MHKSRLSLISKQATPYALQDMRGCEVLSAWLLDASVARAMPSRVLVVPNKSLERLRIGCVTQF